MKVWIDLSNSPHPLLFRPIAARLEERGCEVVVTARDNAQTVELALQRWDKTEVIGGSSPRGRRAKIAAMIRRVGELRRFARRARPDVALSHNSYGQILAARQLRIPVVTAMDFEHQPANHIAFRLAQRVLLPDALRRAGIRRQGSTPRKSRFYPGLKEELYLGDFEPDPLALRRLGIEDGKVVVVARPPPTRAAYHRFDNPLFFETLRVLGRQRDLCCVVLPRFREQRAAIAKLGVQHCVVPATAVDSRSLLVASDLMVGAGGTMTREAALLGVPTVSVFAGEQPAADRWLESRGLLRRLRSLDELLPVTPGAAASKRLRRLRDRGDLLVGIFVDSVLDVARP